MTSNAAIALPPSSLLVGAIERLLLGGIGLTARALAEADAAAELTLPQWRVLVIVGDAGTLRIGELAGRLGVAVPSASRIVRRLETQRLVSAARSEDDRRATDVRLTEDGLTIRKAILERRRELVNDAVRPLMDAVPPETLGFLEALADALAPFA